MEWAPPLLQPLSQLVLRLATRLQVLPPSGLFVSGLSAQGLLVLLDQWSQLLLSRQSLRLLRLRP